MLKPEGAHLEHLLKRTELFHILERKAFAHCMVKTTYLQLQTLPKSKICFLG
jgi:hypothetical protein